jgi:hypothetical protein
MRVVKFVKQAVVLLVATSTVVMELGGVAAAGGKGVAPISMSTASAVDVLAENGIATVANEPATAPLHAVTGSVGIRFTEAQVTSMALGASDHAGVLGSTLDAVAPATKGEPPFSYLLAAWVSSGTSSGAAAVRAVMGTQPWIQAPSLVFPSIALPLFTADAIKAIGVPSGATKTAQAQADGHPAAGRGTAVLMGPISAPCSLVSNFIQDVLDSVFNALKLNGPSGSSVIAKVGSFFVSLWNIAVSFAQQVVTGLVKAVGNAVVGKIALAAAAAASIAEVVSYITPWSAKVAANPASVALGGNAGSFKALVSSGSSSDYPTAVKDCAAALNITLPSLTAQGAKATWTLVGPLTATSATAVTLDHQGSSTLQYRTGPSPCGASATEVESGLATVTVTRSAVDTLKTLVNTWLTSLIGQAATYVKPLLQPLVNSMLSKLDSLTQVSGTGTVILTQPTGAESSQTSCPCPVGHWVVTNRTVSLLGVSGGAGAHWALSPDGNAVMDYGGSAPLVNPSDGMKLQYTGVETDRVTFPPGTPTTATSGTWTAIVLSSSVIATVTIGTLTKTEPVKSVPGTTAQGNWTCKGNDMTTSYPGVGETVSLSRLSS